MTKKKKRQPQSTTSSDKTKPERSVELSGEDYYGADNQVYRDLAVDSDSETVMLWLRKKVRDNKYLLVVSTVNAHVMTKEITEEEAKKMYAMMPARAPRKKAFDPFDEENQ